MRFAPGISMVHPFKSILLLLLLAGQLCAQAYKPPKDPNIDFGDWRVSSEPVEFNIYASMTHLVASAYIANILEEKLPWWQADLTALSLGLLWEVKDGFVPWEKAGLLGGEGFSSNDLKMDFFGVAANRLLPIIFDNVVHAGKGSGKFRPALIFSSISYPKLSLSVVL